MNIYKKCFYEAYGARWYISKQNRKYAAKDTGAQLELLKAAIISKAGGISYRHCPPAPSQSCRDSHDSTPMTSSARTNTMQAVRAVPSFSTPGSRVYRTRARWWWWAEWVISSSDSLSM